MAPSGRAIVRQVVTDWFDPNAGVWIDPPDSLDAVWSSFPTTIDYEEHARLNGIETRAQAVIFITGQEETRRSIGGEHLGWKYVVYHVTLQVFCLSEQDEPTVAMDDVDTLADALKARTVADHRFGQDPTVIFKVAEDGVSLSFGEPMLNGYGATEIWFQLTFDVNTFYQA